MANHIHFQIDMDGINPDSKFGIWKDRVRIALPQLSLYEHQKRALDSISNYFDKRRVGLVILPTGSGKSGIAALTPYIIGAKKVLVVTPSKEITSQLYNDFCGTPSFYEKIEMIPNGRINDFKEIGYRFVKKMEVDFNTCNLVIANAHKFGEKSKAVDLNSLPHDLYDLIIVDEAQHYPAVTWQRIIRKFNSSKILLLTATPFNNEKDIVANQELKTILEQSREGLVVGIEIHRILDLHDTEHQGQIHQAMILVRKTEEAENCVNVLNGYRPNTVGGHYATTNNLDAFNERRIRVLVICNKLLEGYDNPNVSVVGILRNIKPGRRPIFTQFVGRCMRKIRNSGGDNITACIVSHIKYDQQINFDFFCDNRLSEDDPEDDSEDDD